jgi:hypothetical protein
MTVDRVHSKLLNAAARKILRPMGLVQKGTSRLWYDDQGWKAFVVDFQPSNWSRGTYLNVGCCWLWNDEDGFTFDEPWGKERVGAGFEEFKNEKQFEKVALEITELAAKKVLAYRKQFHDIDAASKFVRKQGLRDIHPNFNAGIVCALAGKSNDAKRFLAHIGTDDDDRDWVIDLRKEADRLSRLSSDKKKFRHLIVDKIQRQRKKLKLPVLQSVSFEATQ